MSKRGARFSISVLGLMLLAGVVTLASALHSLEAKPKKPVRYALKNGFYSGSRGPAIVILETAGHRITSISIHAKFRFDGGGLCAPIGKALNIETNTASFEVDRMNPVRPNRKNRFAIPISQKTTGISWSSGWVRGRMTSPKKITVSVKFRQEANDFQGACSMTIKEIRTRYVT